MWFSKIIGQRVAAVLLRCVPVIIFASLLPDPFGLSLPNSVFSFAMFLITLLTGTLLMTSIIVLFHIITLYTISDKGIAYLFCSIADIFTDGVVPIPFFPPFLQKIANILPFRYVSDLPFRLYTGNVSIFEGLNGLLIQFIWFILVLLIGNILLNKSMK